MKRVLKLGLLLVLGGAFFAWGFLVHQRGIFPYTLLRAIGLRSSVGDPIRVNSRTRDADLLRGLPYVDRTLDPQAELRGVIHHVPEKAWTGVNFYNGRADNRALLIDMEGHVLREWTRPTGAWAHAELLPDGDVLALIEHRQVIRVDRDSNEEWSYAGRVHHDLWVAADGDVFVLETEPRKIPELHPDLPVLEDEVVVLSPDGRRKDEISILDALRNSPYGFLVPDVRLRSFEGDREEVQDPELDLLHANHVEVFDGTFADRSPIFAEGNLLVCLRNISTVIVIDGKSRRAVWAWGPSNLTFPHHSTLTAGGNLLIFNNGIQRSSVLELDPLAGRLVWRYAPGRRFFSKLRGSNFRLPNGNTLITESDKGYVLETTPEGEVVWHFANPDVNEAGERGVIWRMKRFRREDLTFLD